MVRHPIAQQEREDRVEMRNLNTRVDFDSLLENSEERPQILLKHSTRCPISRAAFIECEHFAKTDDRADIWVLLVVEDKELAQDIARETGIEHQSPQAMVFKNGRPVWHGSHHAITVEQLGKEISD